MATIDLVYGPHDGGKLAPNMFTKIGETFMVPRQAELGKVPEQYEYKMVSEGRAEFVFPKED